jgi:hypothetical protein
VGVADGISKLRPFAADIANLCHEDSRLDQLSTNFTGVKALSTTLDGR